MKKYISTVAALLCAGLILVSCDKDDEKTDPVRTVTDVNGNYSGKMVVAAAKQADAPGADVKAVVKNDTVYFDSLPVRDIVASIVGEPSADGIVALIGKVSYKVGYTATLNAAKDSIALALAPKPLTLTVPGETPLAVEVAISASRPGMFSYSPEKLNFVLNATEVTLNGAPFEAFTASDFRFSLTK